MALALAVVALATIGCGKKQEADRVTVYPTEGQVLWNGQPLGGALVVLHPVGQTGARALPSRAQTNREGRFHVSTYESLDGAPAGEHSVTIEYYPLQQQGESFVPGPNALPPRYANTKTSDLRVRVAEGKNTLPTLLLRQ